MCREGPYIDRVRIAVLSVCTGDLRWINDREEIRVGNDRQNQGFSPEEIRHLTQAWVRGGGEIYCGPEERPLYRNQRDYVYWIIIEGIDEFPSGLYVEMELTDTDPTDPIVSLLNAHPPTFPQRR